MKPLAGQNVLLTRDAEDCAQWARELEAMHATAVILPDRAMFTFSGRP